MCFARGPADERTLRLAGIEGSRFHDLRHTAVSYMMNGIDLKTIAELVGHTTAEMVDKRYGHLSPDHKRTATRVYGAAMDKLCGYVADGPGVDTFWTLSQDQPKGAEMMDSELADKIDKIVSLRRGSSTVEQSLRKR